jgi:hypothetical protein
MILNEASKLNLIFETKNNRLKVKVLLHGSIANFERI